MNYKKTVESDLIRTSRAGDVFHYRWAARFCLNLIKPGSPIYSITIEQSKNFEEKGECVMDMASYSRTENGNCISYYQMKHTEVHAEKHMTLGMLARTIKGFSDRYKFHFKDTDKSIVKYFVITNRKIDSKLLIAIKNIANGNTADSRIKDQMIRYTNFNESELKGFCSSLVLQGSEGNYEEQFYNLVGDTARLISGVNNSDIVTRLINMIWDRVLPNNKTEITKEVVLNQFGCSSEKNIFPAPSNFEHLDDALKRNEYIRLADEILKDENTKIITATGGIGKSIFTGMLSSLLGEDNITIIYDCFGNGTYRNRLMFRHRHRDALVQIVNELANLGYCEPLIPVDKDPDWISESFQARITDAVLRHKEKHPNGKLIIAIDAADNAEMAGEINEQLAFPSDLIHHKFPLGCILVLLCRPEREHLLKAPRGIISLRMSEFTLEETTKYLELKFPNIDSMIAEEIHTRTNGIPRVISIAIQDARNIQEVLDRLSPNSTTAEDQIHQLLERAKNRIIDQLSDKYLEEINVLCCGLAVLPPDIPLSDLSDITMISEDTIKSFISEMGAQIILVDGHLHFKDEPTEHWFQTTFSEKKDLVINFIERIEPLTKKSFYLAAALPELYIRVGLYDQMIEVVLSGKFLPKLDIADIREVEYTRLRYAVRAAINANRYKDLMALGLMAGEKGEVHNRIYTLYQEYFDIIHEFLSKEPLRELAYKAKLQGSWLGSDKLYTALLLSGLEGCAPEARVYLRNARQFLQIYFEDRKREDRYSYQNSLTDHDIFAFVLSDYNIHGLKKAIASLLSWTPGQLRFTLARKLTSYLIDQSVICEVHKFLNEVSHDLYSSLGIIYELNKVGLSSSEESIGNISKFDFEKLEFSENYLLNEEEAAPMLALITVCERLFMSNETKQCKKILGILLQKVSPTDFKSDYYNYKRAIYLRAHVINKQLNPSIDFFSDLKSDIDRSTKAKSYQDYENIKGIFNSLYPWYELRLKILVGENVNLIETIVKMRQLYGLTYEGQYGRFNNIENERFVIFADLFLKYKWNTETEATEYYEEVINKEKYVMPQDRVSLMRGLMHVTKFYEIIQKLEFTIHEKIVNEYNEPYERVETLMQMVRSFLGYSRREARKYFEEAVNENEKFGDDLPNKWRAITSIARRAADTYDNEHELSYRFIRVAEFVGEHIIREKYWDRNEAMRIATLLSPVQGIAALSRWRERNVGWFNDQMKSVIEALIDKNLLSADQIWGLSGFFPESEHFVIKLAREAIIRASENERMEIARQVNRIAGIKGYSQNGCNELIDLYKQVNGSKMIAYPGIDDNSFWTNSNSSSKKISDSEVDSLLEDWTYEGIDSLKNAFGYVNTVDGLYSSNSYFWKSILSKIPLPKYANFLTEALSCINDFWSIISILKNIPDTWKLSRSFPEFWLEILKDVGKLFSTDLLSSYYRRPLEERTNWSDNEWYQLFTGCVEALKTNYSEFGTSDYYDLASIGCMIESPEESLILLDKALLTVEKDINLNFADGVVQDSHLALGTVNEAYAAFFKCSLGSPDSEVRWMAVHGLVRYGLICDGELLKNTVEMMISSDIVAFLGKRFLFYHMNFQLYMLIALQRIALEQPLKLKDMKDIFAPYFDESFTHGLIQYAVHKIMQSVTCYTDGLFTGEDVEKAEKWFISSIQSIPIKKQKNTKLSDKYKKVAEESSKFHVAYDFDRYTLNTLERLFRIPTNHIEVLIGNYVKETFEFDIDENGWVKDERDDVFRSSRYQNSTYTSHGELPAVERLSYYISYHGMFIIAGRLLKENKIYYDDYYEEEENPYLAWLERNFTFRNDGYLLFDTRTPIPTEIPSWMNNQINVDWLTEVDNNYLVQNMLIRSNVCVKGYWVYQSKGYRETVMIDSALIEKSMVFSLLTTLENLEPHDYYLGNIRQSDEHSHTHFYMEEWIVKKDSSSELDKHDPWAKGTRYPDYEIDHRFVTILDISSNKLNNEWFDINSKRKLAFTENWVVNLGQYNDDYFQPNTRLIAKEELIKDLCNKTGKVLVVNVKIDRSKIKDRYSGDSESERTSFHTFKVIDMNGWWIDEE